MNFNGNIMIFRFGDCLNFRVKQNCENHQFPIVDVIMIAVINTEGGEMDVDSRKNARIISS